MLALTITEPALCDTGSIALDFTVRRHVSANKTCSGAPSLDMTLPADHRRVVGYDAGCVVGLVSGLRLPADHRRVVGYGAGCVAGLVSGLRLSADHRRVVWVAVRIVVPGPVRV
jgi:hypothetical protein